MLRECVRLCFGRSWAELCTWEVVIEKERGEGPPRPEGRVSVVHRRWGAGQRAHCTSPSSLVPVILNAQQQAVVGTQMAWEET